MIRIASAQNAQPLRLAPAGGSAADGYFRCAARGTVPQHDPLALDLVEIGTAIHLADRSMRRSKLMYRRRRQIKVVVPVRDPELWTKARPLLSRLASFASADEWTLAFTRKPGSRKVKHVRPKDQPGAVVALFSGGLDSLCGCALLARNRSRPVFVTHSPPGQGAVNGMVRDVWTACGRLDFAEVQFASFRTEVREAGNRGKRAMFHEQTRRTRPFFFLSLACAVALESGIARVQMSENGALALSLPYRSDAYGGAIARQAHAILIDGFTELLNFIAPRPATPWRVFNPFVALTKGEACALLRGAAAVSRRAMSCEYVGRKAANVRGWRRRNPRSLLPVGEGPQCGLCLPCLVRRAALHRARISDPNRGYFFDAGNTLRRLKSGRLPPRNLQPPLFDYVSSHVVPMEVFCRQVIRMSQFEFATRYLPELASHALSSEVSAVTPRMQFNLIRRFAREMLSYLKA